MTSQPTDPTTPAPPDNQRSGDQQSSSALKPREEFLSALRAGRPEHTPEQEGVLLIDDGKTITLVLDDNERLEFDASELQHAVEGP